MADAAVFDVDTQESMQRWNDFHARTAKPGIALSVTPHQIDGAVWVQKPVTPAALLAAAAALNAGKWHRTAPAAASPVAVPSVTPVTPATPEPLVQVETRREAVAPAPAAQDEAPRTTTQRPDFGGLMRQVLNPPPAALESHKPNFERFVAAAPAPAPAPAPYVAPAPSYVAPSSPAVEPEPVLEVAQAPSVQELPAPEPVVAESHDTGKQDALVISQQEKHDEELLCGTREDASPADLASSSALRYDPNQYLIAALKEAYLVSAKWRVPTQFDLPEGAVVVDTLQNHIYLGFDPAKLTQLYGLRMTKRPKTRVVSAGDFAKMRPRFESSGAVLRADALLWRAAMETAGGRLPTGVNPDKPVYLKHWPNMTRLQRTPHSLRIAAAWAIKGASISETARVLNIPQRYIFAFYNAALELDLVTEDGSHIHRAKRKGPGNRGLLTRLFNWLGK
jgi:hypothetical protein